MSAIFKLILYNVINMYWHMDIKLTAQSFFKGISGGVDIDNVLVL